MIGDLFTRPAEPLQTVIFDWVTAIVPRLTAAAIVVATSWLLAVSARWISGRAVRAEWLERLLIRSGVLSGLFEPSRAQSRRLVSLTLYWAILTTGVMLALAILSDRVAAGIEDLTLIVLPKAALALAILAVSWWLSRYWARSALIWTANEGLAFPWRWAALVRACVLSFGVALASEATGFAAMLFRCTFLILLAGATFVFAQAAAPVVKAHFVGMLDAKRRDAANLENTDDSLLR